MSLFTMRPGVRVIERQVRGGCIRLTVNDEHVAHVLSVRRRLERMFAPPARKVEQQ
jgi:hypothetical protein